jgi:hypothetical protein
LDQVIGASNKKIHCQVLLINTGERGAEKEGGIRMIGKAARLGSMMRGTGALVEVGRGIEEEIEIEIMSMVETENMGGTGTGTDTEDRSKGSQLLSSVVLVSFDAKDAIRYEVCFYCHLI